MEMWIRYQREVEGANTYYTDKGFFTYKFSDDGEEMFVTNFYVRPEYRGKGVGFKMSRTMEHIAKDAKCSHMSCNVYKYQPKWDKLVKAHSRLGGFVIQDESEHHVLMIKEL